MPLRSKLERLGSQLERRFLVSRIYRRVFGTGDGRLVLEDLLTRFGWTDRPTFAVGSPDAAATSAYFEGQRSVWNYIQSQMHMSETEMRELRRDAVHHADPLAMGGDS